MPCYGPLKGFYSAEVGKSGKRGIVFDVRRAHSPVPIAIPCGQCVGCKLEHSRQWAMRCLHEKKLHRENCFVTLTYDNDHLPEGGTLVKRDLQLFLKRLRKKCGSGIRFYACGEYGDVGSRPHYHVLLFNHNFSDRKVIRGSKPDKPLSTSADLDAVWQKGLSVIGEVTFESAAYVARYVMKKISGDRADEHYSRVDDCGRIYRVLPEFTVMSRRPGIGLGWYRKFGKETFIHDSVVVNGHLVRPPRYYDTQLALTDPDRMAYLKSVRRQKAKLLKHDNTPGYHGRLHVKEKIARATLAQKERKL